MPALVENTNYIVVVRQGSDVVSGNAMADLSLRIENKWINILEALGISADSAGVGGMAGDIVNGVLLATGNNFLPQVATSHVWRASTGIELNLQFRFDAVDDAARDVLVPVQTLVKMFTPTRSGLFLHPPGPTPAEYLAGTSGQRSFVVQIGRVMNITNLIPTTIDWKFEHRYTTSGDPIAALVTLGFISYTLPAQDEILAMFVNQNGNTPGFFTPPVTTNSNPAFDDFTTAAPGI